MIAQSLGNWASSLAAFNHPVATHITKIYLLPGREGIHVSVQRI